MWRLIYESKILKNKTNWKVEFKKSFYGQFKKSFYG